MGLITTCISVKQTCLQVNSAYVNVFVMRLCVCVCDRIQVQSLNECLLFFSIFRLTVNCEESDCSLVNCDIVCFFMWRCTSASAPRCSNNQYERSDMKVRMLVKIIQCWPSGM
jgi:hypothetical protein